MEWYMFLINICDIDSTVNVGRYKIRYGIELNSHHPIFW
jgi:hypothetical protein